MLIALSQAHEPHRHCDSFAKISGINDPIVSFPSYFWSSVLEDTSS